MSPTILVTGATGAQGSGVVKQLLAQNIAVHAFVRDPTSPAALALQTAGAILFKGDYDDVPSITAAIQGCTGVFLNTFPSFTDPDGEGHQAENFITAAHATGTVTTFIASTVMRPTEEQLAAVGTQYPFVSYYYKQKKGVEDRVKNAGFKYHTILQPGFLMYNFIAPTTMYHFPDYPTTHIMKAHWGPDFEIELFDPADVGKFALAAFLDPGSFNGETLYLVNESLTTDQVAVKISKATGIEIGTGFYSEEETKAVLDAGTFPTAQSQRFFDGHRAEPKGKHLEKYGIEMGTLDGYLVREKNAFLKTLGVGKED